eukprot:573890-Alexandrium_andersonii.AAC.1
MRSACQLQQRPGQPHHQQQPVSNRDNNSGDRGSARNDALRVRTARPCATSCRRRTGRTW